MILPTGAFWNPQPQRKSIGAFRSGLSLGGLWATHVWPDGSAFDNLRALCPRQNQGVSNASLANVWLGRRVTAMARRRSGTWSIVAARYSRNAPEAGTTAIPIKKKGAQ